MALWKFSNLNKYGNLRTRIIYLEDGKPFSFNPKGFGKSVFVSRFKYEHSHLYAPVLFTDSTNQKYILPNWQPVLPETTLNDVTWVKPVIKKEQPTEKNVWKFESSSSPNTFYFVRQNGNKLTCSCSGFFRAFDREKGCVHCQTVRKQLK
jgi:hypothetical protein